MDGFWEGVKVFSGLLAPVVALFAVSIAWRQYKMAKDKLKLDLFDRRYRVYRALMDLFTEISNKGTVTLADLGTFSRESDQKRFLFKDDLIEYITAVRQKALDLKRLDDTIEKGKEEEARAKAIDEKLELERWFDAQIDGIAAQKFSEYLDFKKL
jgi:hypothetical protein